MTSTSDCRFLPTGLCSLPLALMHHKLRRPKLAVYADALCMPPAPTSLPPLVRRPLLRQTPPPRGLPLRWSPHFPVSSTLRRLSPLARLSPCLRPPPPPPRTTPYRPSQRSYTACGAISTPHARSTCDVNSPPHKRTSAPSGPGRQITRLHRRPRRPLPLLLSLLLRRLLWRPPWPPRRRSFGRRASPPPRAPPRPPVLPRSCGTSSAGTPPLTAAPPLGPRRRNATTTPPTSNFGAALPGPPARTAHARSIAIPRLPRGTLQLLPRPLPRPRSRTLPGTSA